MKGVDRRGSEAGHYVGRTKRVRGLSSDEAGGKAAAHGMVYEGRRGGGR